MSHVSGPWGSRGCWKVTTHQAKRHKATQGFCLGALPLVWVSSAFVPGRAGEGAPAWLLNAHPPPGLCCFPTSLPRKHTENRAAGVVGDRTGSSCTGQCSSPGGPSKGPQLCSRSQRKVAENTGRQFSAGREHRLTARLTRDVQDQLSGRETPSVPSFPPNVQSLSLNSHRDASHLPSTSDRSCPWGQPETRARKHIEGPPLLPTARPPCQSHRSPGHR